jgi:hypothetical protein
MMEMRSYPRVEVFHPVYYQNDSSPSAQVASTHDLSVGGAAIESVGTIALGETFNISLVIPPQIIRCKAKVVHALRLIGEKVRAGVQFEDISKEDILYLEGYIDLVMKQLVHGKNPGFGLLIGLALSLLFWAVIVYLLVGLI